MKQSITYSTSATAFYSGTEQKPLKISAFVLKATYEYKSGKQFVLIRKNLHGAELRDSAEMYEHYTLKER